MGDLVKTESKTKYNQRVVGSKTGKDSGTSIEARSLTGEQTGTQNEDRKSQGQVVGSEEGVRDTTGNTEGRDTTIGTSEGDRKSESSRLLTAKSTASVVTSQKVNIGMVISFRVPIHGKFPTSDSPQSSSC